MDDQLSVLVVDAFVDAAISLATLIRLWGFHATIAETGGEALKMITRLLPDVVLLELMMPDTDGWDLVHELRERMGDRRPLIIATTVYGRECDQIRSLEAGVALHLVKPVDPDRLGAILRRIYLSHGRLSNEAMLEDVSRYAPPFLH